MRYERDFAENSVNDYDPVGEWACGVVIIFEGKKRLCFLATFFEHSVVSHSRLIV